MIKKPLFFCALIIFIAGFSFASEKPLTLSQCLEIALSNNPDILRAEAERQDAVLQTELARAELLPSLGAGLGYTHSVAGPSSQTYLDPLSGIQRQTQPFSITSRNFSSGLNFSQTIYDGGYAIANYQKSQYDEEASVHSYENSRQNVIYAVNQAYFELLKQKQLLIVFTETVKSSEEALKKAQSMEQIGSAPHSDVLKAKVKYETDRMNLLKSENSLEIAKANLNHTLGLNVNEAVEIEETVPEIDFILEYDQAIKIALENHPALKQSSTLLASAQKYIRMAQSSYLPQISGSVNYGWYNEDFGNVANMFDQDYNWSAQLSLEIPIFDGFARRANLNRSKVNYRSLQDQYQQTERQLLLEVKTAHLGLLQAEKQIALARESLLSAEEDLKQSTARYQLGSGTMLELIDAEVALTSAKAQLIQAQYDRLLAQTRLKKAIGKLN
jgi:TolC family type I secretion outer membrane protein